MRALVGLCPESRLKARARAEAEVSVATGFMGLLLVYAAISVRYWNYVAAHMPKS
jgi:hypothetical protein